MRNEAIEQAAKVIADKPYSTMDGRKFFCLYETNIIDDLRKSLALPKDATEPVKWNKILDCRPHLGQVVILCLNGVVQNETYTYDQGDSDYGTGDIFWGRDDLDECPSVTDDDRWLPLPMFNSHPKDLAERDALMARIDNYLSTLSHNDWPEHATEILHDIKKFIGTI